MASTKFDIDDSKNQKSSVFDVMIKENEIQKGLESDELIFMEGSRNYKNLISEDEIYDDRREANEAELLSACDFEQEFDYKFSIIKEKT